jgi:hypothetical protein
MAGLWRRRSGKLVAVTVALFALAGGVAYATIPDGSGVYTACTLNHIGTIRLIDPSLPAANLLSHCTALETKITWNQQGQPGPQGPKGNPGPQGPPGASSYQALDGSPCTLGGKSGTTLFSQGDGQTSFFSNADCVVPDGWEPDNTQATAAPLDSFAYFTDYALTIDPAGESDWYSLSQTKLSVLDVIDDRGLPGAADFSVELYRDGTLVATSVVEPPAPSPPQPDVQSGGAELTYFGDGTTHNWLIHVTSPDLAVYYIDFDD